MNPAPQRDIVAFLSSSACSVEILVHRVLLSVIFLPFAFLVFPFLTFHIGVSLVNVNLSDDWRQWRHLAAKPEFVFLTDAQEIALATALVLLMVLLSAARYRRSLRQLENPVPGERRYREPKGNRGLALKMRIAILWSRVALQATPPPEVFWFPNSAVLAQAMTRSGHPEIAVSTGLWERIEDSESIADLILLHELAHLAYGDPDTFRSLSALLSAVTRCVMLLLRVLIVTIGFLLVQQAVVSYRANPQQGFILRQEVAVAGIGLIALSLCPVTAAMLRRYIGLIVSLIELRADACAAQWAGGLERFVKVLSNHPMVHKSTLTDRARSLFSLDLTHLSETERLEILSDPSRILTPKVQYFAFSLVLVLLLPLNGLTPLFEGGVVDLAAVITVAAALMMALTAMLVLAGRVTNWISPARLLALSACATGFTAACQINLYTFVYSLSTSAVEIGLGRPSLSENGSSLSVANFLSVMGYAFVDIRNQLTNIWSRGWIALSVVITMAAFTGLLVAARNVRGLGGVRSWLPAIASIASGVGVLLDGYDQWRSFVIEDTLFGRVFAGWASVTHRLPGIRFTLGPCLALAVVLILRVLGLAGHNIQKARRAVAVE